MLVLPAQFYMNFFIIFAEFFTLNDVYIVSMTRELIFCFM